MVMCHFWILRRYLTSLSVTSLLSYLVRQLLMFMHLCRLNYVDGTTVDVELNTLEVCSQISALHQVYIANGRVTHDTPDEMLDKFLQLAVILPDNSSTWSVQLCSRFLSALFKDLANNVISESKF